MVTTSAQLSNSCEHEEKTLILLGLILLIVGYFLFRPLVYVGGVLILIGVVLWLAAAPGPIYGYYL